MTKWQWQVILALIRYTLAHHHYELLIQYTDKQKSQDATLLAEALRRTDD